MSRRSSRQSGQWVVDVLVVQALRHFNGTFQGSAGELKNNLIVLSRTVRFKDASSVRVEDCESVS